MIAQSPFMVVAPVALGRVEDLRALLATMNDWPGMADPANDLVPFGRFERLHVARFVILDDPTLNDLHTKGQPPAGLPIYLAFLGDCDGEGDDMLAAFAAGADPGLRRIFSLCEGFDEKTPLLDWMRQHNVTPAVEYVNWVGRTVRQVREEADLHIALAAHLRSANEKSRSEDCRAIRDRLIAAVKKDGLQLSGPEPTPLDWRLRQILHAIWALLAGTVALIAFVLYAPFFFWQLRRREKTDAVFAPRPDPAHVKSLALREDHYVSNSFSAIGSVKPGLFRLLTLRFIFWVVANSTRHIYTRGKLARVGTIHFARWVFLDDRRRLFFGSNYDGSLDSYMDDFINKVAFGLNLVFSNGVGYPHTDFLINGGAKDERTFKNYIRRHQVPTDVWYKAYPGLTTFDLARNARIREGFTRQSMEDDEIREWLALIQ
jgi:hypothetical protein